MAGRFIARCYSLPMLRRQSALPFPWPGLWLVSDARNDAALDAVLARLPRGSGFIFRHYHLQPAARRARFVLLQRRARRHGHCIVLAADVALARQWRADGAYGSARSLTRGPAFPRLITAHDLRQIGHARRATAILLSPVFASASHPGGATLGPLRFRALALRARQPVIALGGMTARQARRLRWRCWAAIDGLSASGGSGRSTRP